jgi:hypothetical protein
MRNQRIPKETAIAIMEGTRKRGRSCRRWRDDVENLNIMRIKNRQAMATDHQDWRKTYWKPRFTMECSACGGGESTLQMHYFRPLTVIYNTRLSNTSHKNICTNQTVRLGS